ncbi:MAG: type IX secretion system PorP/SprF family membrane protein [Luteibaculaceae bacterium]|jgi:type IX secretion system PorP/SprF family membrane protein
MRYYVYISLMIFLGLHGQIQGQQIPNLSSGVYNHFHQNAGYTGNMDDCVNITLGFVDQWTIFKRAPTTRFADLHTSIRNPSKRRKPYFHSAGLSVETDHVGVFGQSNIRFSYAYHFPIARNYMVGAGTFIGYRDMRYDPSVAILEEIEDPVFEGETFTMTAFPTINPGVWINNDRNYFGLSYFQALGGEMEFVGLGGNNFERYLILDLGLTHDLGNIFTVLTTLQAIQSKGLPLYTQWNAILKYQDVISLGVGSRSDAFIGLFSLKFIKVFEVGYSYDLLRNKLYDRRAEKHEVQFSIKPCWPKKKRLFCPAY